MIIDKSQDYLLQNSTLTVTYRRKTVEGDVTFNSTSVATFSAGALTVPYVVREASQRVSPDFIQEERRRWHVFRTPWLAAGAAGDPQESDKFYDGQAAFWVVEEIDFTDQDDSGFYQRYTLTCVKSTKPVTA